MCDELLSNFTFKFNWRPSSQRQQDKSVMNGTAAADALAAAVAEAAGGGDSSITGRLQALRVQSASAGRINSLRVLLVDDNSASQQAMRRIIINAGMLCDVAGNGKEALALIEVGRCRLTISKSRVESAYDFGA